MEGEKEFVLSSIRRRKANSGINGMKGMKLRNESEEEWFREMLTPT